MGEEESGFTISKTQAALGIGRAGIQLLAKQAIRSQETDLLPLLARLEHHMAKEKSQRMLQAPEIKMLRPGETRAMLLNAVQQECSQGLDPDLAEIWKKASVSLNGHRLGDVYGEWSRRELPAASTNLTQGTYGYLGRIQLHPLHRHFN